MRFWQAVSLVACGASCAGALHHLESDVFNITVDSNTGALLSIVNPKDNATMNWIGGPGNAPWQPLGSRWGIGYADTGKQTLPRAVWNNPRIASDDRSIKATYTVDDDLVLDVTRELDRSSSAFTECYSFLNSGNESLTLNDAGTASLAIYTPFNDHYTSTTDVLEHRAHAHIWAMGGSSSWVKMTRMGLRGPHLGLVLTEGALSGYSVESRDTITSSNTRGVFLLHPDVPTLESGQSGKVCWQLFWHDDWDDFFKQCAARSQQFVDVEASSLTAVEGETVNLTFSGAITSDSTLQGGDLELQKHEESYSTSFQADKLGQTDLTLTTGSGSEQRNATFLLNTVPPIDELIANRTKFITTRQQLSPSSSDPVKAGAYAVYDNQLDAIVTFDQSSDRNTARERVGMGVLLTRWLKERPDEKMEQSLRIYYDYVNNRLQNSSGWVHDGPLGSGDTQKRLYNWPWIMQLHLGMAKLGYDDPITSNGNYTATPLQRFLRTVESFYAEGGSDFYPIDLPIYESLRFLNESGNKAAFDRVLELFTHHGEIVAQTGRIYPPSEVNFEQSIVAPAANILLELYRATGNQTWLRGVKPHFDLLEAFGGRQPDYRLHDVAIRHWDGYWFGKERLWGDTFPHYWSTLTAIAMHHYAKATGDESYGARAEGILRANLKLFTPDGRGSCAFIYPLTVNGREGDHGDPYANDQDWALAHLLYIRRDK